MNTPRNQTTPPPAKTLPQDPQEQREQLLESERQANAQQPRNFKDDALSDKVVSVEPDGTGPTPTDTFDPEADRQLGSGSSSPSKPPSKTA